MRVAFTSSDGHTIDEHFGQATHFHVWEIGPDRAESVGIVGAFGGQGRMHGHGPDHVAGLGLGAFGRPAGQADEPGPARQRAPDSERGFAEGLNLERAGGLGGPSRPPQQDDEDDRIKARADAIEGCTLVYTVQIGGPAAAKLVARHIHPMKTGAELPIAAAVAKLQEVLRGRPPPWLRKAMGLAPAAATTGGENEEL